MTKPTPALNALIAFAINDYQPQTFSTSYGSCGTTTTREEDLMSAAFEEMLPDDKYPDWLPNLHVLACKALVSVNSDDQRSDVLEFFADAFSYIIECHVRDDVFEEELLASQPQP